MQETFCGNIGLKKQRCPKNRRATLEKLFGAECACGIGNPAFDNFFLGRIGAMCLQSFQICIFVNREGNGAAVVPAGVLDGIHQFNTGNAFPTINEQRFQTQDGIGKIVNNTHVLGIFTVGLHIDAFKLQAGENAIYSFGKFLRVLCVAIPF